MEGNNSISRPSDMLIRIRDFTRSIIKGMCKEQSSFVVHIDRFRNYCTDSSGHCCCSSYTAKGKELITLQRECHVHRLDVLLRVLLIVQQLLQENKHGSKRDIFYMHPSVFREQSVVDRAINDICILLQCRHNLNVVSVGKGLVMGWLRFSEAGRIFDCINSPNSAHPVPVNVEEVKDIMSVAKYILIVEKESVFQRLSNDQFCKKNQCIVITTSRELKHCCVDVTWKEKCQNGGVTQVYLLELELLLQRGVKFEIEALSAHSLSFLSEVYVPSKLKAEPSIQQLGSATQTK
ncbi:meiotic recombination protein SPO11-1-like isoform X11 [Daucus carota subsp. sativus]|uniref:meiotic recombination protein SPO11-1-like isoform X11 n=1 Tax=Daucus carota subsp. sativus TaxID=79200 RepID=UPI0030831EA8